MMPLDFQSHIRVLVNAPSLVRTGLSAISWQELYPMRDAGGLPILSLSLPTLVSHLKPILSMLFPSMLPYEGFPKQSRAFPLRMLR
jgi:hypothetical protein